jgi:hypothetical protein
MLCASQEGSQTAVASSGRVRSAGSFRRPDLVWEARAWSRALSRKARSGGMLGDTQALARDHRAFPVFGPSLTDSRPGRSSGAPARSC